MRKIFIFESGTTGWGGSFKSCYFTVLALKKNDYSVFVGCVNQSDYWQKLEERGVCVKRFFHKFYSREIRGGILNRILRQIDKFTFQFLSAFVHRGFTRQIAKFIKNEKFDLIHANTNFQRDLAIVSVAKKLNLPIASQLRTDPYHKLTLREKKLAKYEKIVFIAVSKAMRNKWIRAGLPGEKIKVIYNAQPSLTLANAGQKEYALSSDSWKAKILFVGRLSKIKGLDTLFQALSEIDKELWTLSVVGGGEERNTLEKNATNKRIIKNITFFGFQEEIGEFYASHDILVVPSRRESFGRVIIEAMQFSVPVIASNIDGPAEIIENGKDGLLFETGNADELARTIEFLIKNPQKRAEIGLAGKEKQKIFSEDIFEKKLMKVYNDLLNPQK